MKTIKWSATFLTILGAIFTSLDMYPWNVVAFNFGSLLWVWFAMLIKEKSLIVVNVGLLLVYVAGLVKFL